MRFLPLFGLLPALVLTACLDRGEYPSLKPRAFEVAARNAAPPAPPPPTAAARPEIAARAAALVVQGQAGQRAFAAELARARPIIARAGGPDSESWITAQEQLSGLEASRAETVTALAELDALNLAGVGAAGLRFGEADFAVLRAAGNALGALLDDQQRELAALASMLADPV